MYAMKNLKLTFYLIAFVLGSHALNGGDLATFGATCPGRDSCLEMGDANFTQRNCECDIPCSVFGDCCIDAFLPRTSRSHKYKEFACMEFGHEPGRGVYAVTNCPLTYNGPVGIRDKCEIEDDHSDPIASAPVTDTKAGITYRSRYCSLCNKADATSLTSFLIVLNCEQSSSFNFNESFVWQHIKYNEGLKTWGVESAGDFYKCELSFDQPSNLTSGIRLCRTNITSTCPNTWNSLPVLRACHSYTGVVYTTTGVAYRNVDCALCNGESVDELYCDRDDASASERDESFPNELLFDTNTSDSYVVKQVIKCPSGQKFDPFVKKCRNLE